jgi:hypothetical protein
MSIKLTKGDRDRRAALIAELAEAAGKVDDAVALYNATVHAARTELDAVITAYNEKVAEASNFADEIATGIESAIEEKSEAWQESERGEAAVQFCEAWQGIDLSELDIEDADGLELGELDHAAILDALPVTPES